MDLKIAQVRKRRGWTQQQLAEAAGYNLASIGKLEAGLVGWTHNTLRVLSDALGVEEHELLGYAAPPDEDLSDEQRAVVRVVSRLDEVAVGVVLQTANALASAGRVWDEDPTTPLPDPIDESPRPSAIDWPGTITEMLKERSWTQQELAEELGLTPAAINRWLMGSRRPARAMRAKLLRMAGKDDPGTGTR